MASGLISNRDISQKLRSKLFPDIEFKMLQ